MRHPANVIRALRQTEKSTRIAKDGQYVVEVLPSANKAEIQAEVERVFNVKVLKVNTMRCHGKWRRLGARRGRRPDWKKAIVTLASGQKLEVK